MIIGVGIDVTQVSRFAEAAAREVIAEGRRVAREALPEIRAALERAVIPRRG